MAIARFKDQEQEIDHSRRIGKTALLYSFRLFTSLNTHMPVSRITWIPNLRESYLRYYLGVRPTDSQTGIQTIPYRLFFQSCD